MPLIPDVINNKLRKVLRSSDYKDSGTKKTFFLNTVNQHLGKHLSDINVQTLIIWGDRDEELKPKHAKELKQGIKDSKIRLVYGCGHGPNVEKPQELARILKEEL